MAGIIFAGKLKVSFEEGEWVEKAETIQFADEISFTITSYTLCPKKEAKPQTSQAQAQNEPAITEAPYTSSNDFDSVYLKTSKISKQSLSKNDSLNLKSDQSASMTNLPPRAMADLLNKSNDFQISPHHNHYVNTPLLAYWYGLTKLVVITPTRSSNYIDTESRSNIVLSSVSVAINNTGWYVYFFYLNIFFVLLNIINNNKKVWYRCSFR